uniref:Sulfotransferase domain-containing protein n=2 Tax=Ditylum brightwellii TaxID=49249 RepID=A0A7S4R2F0_9STRA|mmetsp:Transcript_44462/g.67006  ORF Transcript_44462/g.67006 Transcript_44462/m.67006 type:complete len:263 (+) Transcript_44462:166-954(+)
MTLAGLDRAKKQNLIASNLADVIITPYIYEANAIFPADHKGRLFAIFRNPIDRAVDLLHYCKIAHWEESIWKPELMSMSLSQYASSQYIENNPMTRRLSNTPNHKNIEVTNDHLTKAMEVLRTRILVGLYEELEESMDRFERYHQWIYRVNPVNQELCRNRFLSRGFIHPNPRHPQSSSVGGENDLNFLLKEGSDDYHSIAWHNQYDLELYRYAKELFKEQAHFVEDVPLDVRHFGETCCKCGPPTFPAEPFKCPGGSANVQ